MTAEARKLAEAEAPAILEELAAVGTEGGEENDARALFAVMSKFREQGTAAGETLCKAFKLQAQEAGSGKTGDERLDQARRDTRRILRDTMIRGMLSQIAPSPDGSDKYFELLGVSTTSPDGAQLQGAAALQTLGLLDSAGKIVIPERGTQQYEDYER